MLSEWLHYQGKTGFLIEFFKWYFSKYWQVQTRQVFTQTITYRYITYRLLDQQIDSVTNYYLCILYVMWFYALPKQSSPIVTCRSWLYACTCTSYNTYNSYTIKYLCGATKHLYVLPWKFFLSNGIASSIE